MLFPYYFPVQNDDFSVQNNDFPEKNDDFPVQNDDFSVRNDDFPVWNDEFSVQNCLSSHRPAIPQVDAKSTCESYCKVGSATKLIIVLYGKLFGKSIVSLPGNHRSVPGNHRSVPGNHRSAPGNHRSMSKNISPT